MRRTSQLTLIDSDESSTSLCGILKTLLFSIILVDAVTDLSTEIVPLVGMDVTGQPSSEANRVHPDPTGDIPGAVCRRAHLLRFITIPPVCRE